MENDNDFIKKEENTPSIIEELKKDLSSVEYTSYENEQKLKKKFNLNNLIESKNNKFKDQNIISLKNEEEKKMDEELKNKSSSEELKENENIEKEEKDNINNDKEKNISENNNENDDMKIFLYDNEEKKEEEEKKNKEEEKIKELKPLSCICMNHDHGNKYISLNHKRDQLICKSCLYDGENETNIKYINNSIIQEESSSFQNEKISKSKDNIQSEEKKIENYDLEPNPNTPVKNETTQNNTYKCLTSGCDRFPNYIDDTCRNFICYHCLIKNMDEKGNKIHLDHDIESVNFISNSFKDDIKMELETINQFDICLDYLIESEKKNNENFQILKTDKKKEIKDYIIHVNNNILALMTENNKNKFLDFNNKFFDKNDAEEIKDLLLSSNMFRNKNKELLEKLKILKDTINNVDISSEEKCDMVQKYQSLIKEINILIGRGNDLIKESNNKLNEINEQINKNRNELEKNLNDTKLLNDELFLIQNVSNKRQGKGAYELRRFASFKYEGYKYFNYSSVELVSKSDIILYGLFLCCLSPSKKIKKEENFEKKELNDKEYIDINIKIYENDSGNALIDEDKKIFQLIKPNNPAINVIFDKYIKMEKDKRYSIVIENKNLDKYTNIWVGKIYKKFMVDDREILRCNCTGYLFEFYMARMHSSDFDEFDQGIIEGILYGI